MPNVPDRPISKGEVRPKTAMIVCTTDGKPLHPDDQKVLDEYIKYRLKRAKKIKPVSKDGGK